MNGQSSATFASNGITPLQQMVASCSGAIITSLVGEWVPDILKGKKKKVWKTFVQSTCHSAQTPIVSLSFLVVTPLDVVKIRLQAQKNPFPKGMWPNCLSCVICLNESRTAWRLSSIFDWYTPLFLGKCFVYCNGLMDHICVCENGNTKVWYKAPGHFTGTLVKYYIAAWHCTANRNKI